MLCSSFCSGPKDIHFTSLLLFCIPKDLCYNSSVPSADFAKFDWNLIITFSFASPWNRIIAAKILISQSMHHNQVNNCTLFTQVKPLEKLYAMSIKKKSHQGLTFNASDSTLFITSRQLFFSQSENNCHNCIHIYYSFYQGHR